MLEEKTEGIVLKTIPFKENHLIVSLFTPQTGMIGLLAKRVSTPEKRVLLSPFSQIEVIYSRKQSDLYLFKDGTLLSDHRFLRDKWEYLEIAGKMGHAVLHSQLPGKPAPLLYALLIASLKQLPLFEEPPSLLLLFYLKLLTHEGILSWSDRNHFPFVISSDAWQILKELTKSRSFKPLQTQKGLSNLLLLVEKNLKEIL